MVANFDWPSTINCSISFLNQLLYQQNQEYQQCFCFQLLFLPIRTTKLQQRNACLSLMTRNVFLSID